MRKGADAKPKQASKARVATPAKKRPAQRAPGKVSDPRLTLGADCTLREAASLQAELISLVSPTGRVIIEGGAVERVDAAALQLLVAFARRETAAGRSLSWGSASGELLSAGARLGLLDSLSLSAPAPGAA